ncbi:MAG: phage terminase large subunit, partial [Shewanella oncorhynchi]
TTKAMYDEEDLQDKELKQGLAKFMLQFMVHSGMTDQERYKLKLENLIVAAYNVDQGPIMPIWNMGQQSQWQSAPRFATRPQDKFYEAMSSNYEVRKFDLTVMYIDPSGGGSRSQDEMGYSIVSLLGTYIYIKEASGVNGGYDTVELMKLVNTAKTNKVDVVYVEENYGKGAHLAALKPLFEVHYPECRIEGIMESGQKELRIIDTLQPLLGQHRIVVSKQCVLKDYEDIQRYASDVKMTYSLFYQMAMITSDRGALRHDDRLDALAGAVRQLVGNIDYDQARAEADRQKDRDDAWVQCLSDPSTYEKFMMSGGLNFDPQPSQPNVNALGGLF